MTRASGWRRRAQGSGLRARGFWALATGLLALALGPQPLARAQSVPGKPIIVTIPQDPAKSELSGLSDVLLGSLGLTGVIVLAAVLLGVLMAVVMFWVRSRDSS
jgi:hypothetical protein